MAREATSWHKSIGMTFWIRGNYLRLCQGIYYWWSQVSTSQPSSAFSQPTVSIFLRFDPYGCVSFNIGAFRCSGTWLTMACKSQSQKKKHHQDEAYSTISTIQRTTFFFLLSVNRFTHSMPVPLAASKWAEVQMCPLPICSDRPKKLVVYLRFNVFTAWKKFSHDINDISWFFHRLSGK